MVHKALSLNGAWEMAYSPERYDGENNPFNEKGLFTAGSVIENAVPGFWEDMTESFLFAEFFGKLKINPEYGLQQYPISGTCPDRLKTVGGFSDVYASYTNGQHSYRSIGGDFEAMDEWHKAYNKPRLSHEICIDGTYTDLGKKANFTLGKTLKTVLSVSHYGEKSIEDATLTVRLFADGKIAEYKKITVSHIENGDITEAGIFEYDLPNFLKPVALKLCVTLDGDGVYAENEWEHSEVISDMSLGMK